MSEVFAAIDVGSYEIAIKIFEISGKGRLKCLDSARRRIDLGTDSYNMGRLSKDHMDDLCNTLESFKMIMKTYKVSAYKAYATSALRELDDKEIALDQIRLRTGIDVEIIANSEQRFLNLKAIAVDSERFNNYIGEGAAVLDIGGGSVQISIFEQESLIASQNLDLGILRIRDRLKELSNTTTHYERFIEEVVDSELHILRKLYLKENPVKTLILVDDYISFLLANFGADDKKLVKKEDFFDFVERIKNASAEDISKRISVPIENAELIIPSAVLIKHFVESTKAEYIWMPGVTLADGIGFEYAQKNGLLKTEHDFTLDILSCARNISKRYKGSKRRGNSLELVALSIFDALKESQDFNERDRLLLRLSCILQDCGKYISTKAAGDSGYDIIMNTDILGLSDEEKSIVANVVRQSNMPLRRINLETLSLRGKKRVLYTKLTAICLLGLCLSRSQKKWFSQVSSKVKGSDLILTLTTQYDITLERALMKDTNTYFQDVYGLSVIVKGSRVRQEI